MIQLNLSSFNYELEDFKYNKYDNVKNYKYEDCSPILYIDLNQNDNILGTKEYYYIFDCAGKDAFCHWVYEIFIFYNYFLKIREIHPNIKILTNNTKKYVKNFFKLFNIDNLIINKIETLNNCCYFSPIFSLNDHNINVNLYKKLIEDYTNYIKSNILIKHNILSINKILFLPRNTKDNFASNDRSIINSQEITDKIIEFGGSVLFTYEINNLYQQFNIINSFDTIILDYGSSYMVNCMFLENKKILVIDNFGHSYQINSYISMNILNEYITKNNNVIFLRPENNGFVSYKQIIDLL